jgi:hypothetical protein
MKKPREVIQPRWGVYALYALRKKAVRLGAVEARNENDAIKRALKEIKVPKASQPISLRRES